MVDYLYFALYKLFGFILTILPRKMMITLMRGISWFAYTISKKHQHIIHTNLDIAFDKSLTKAEKKSYGISAFMNLLDTTLGIIGRDKLPKDRLLQNITFEGESIVKKYQDEGRSIIFITGHQGNWELLSQAIAVKFNLTVVGVGRELDSKLMDKILKKNRERFNVEMVYKKGAMKGCIKALGKNKSIGILVDQSIRVDQSIEVNFFNHPATHTPLASILSRKFKIDLVPAFISTDDYINYHIKIYEPIETIKTEHQEEDLRELTQAQADAMQVAIEAHPKEWFWMHKRWKNTIEDMYKKGNNG